ncbi:transcriptional regulator TACO1-like protein [Syncephalastrum racemosum]|uniref:Transcriptional regulator TACO1-like protein n=1 Tax=Syncephalastrum racemosum TaxID=13706 RepID=A0A1X2HMA1_SYNRA|nr:transcriptional regulator TACO1-like protein [Syncephalastrum racemosum]
MFVPLFRSLRYSRTTTTAASATAAAVRSRSCLTLLAGSSRPFHNAPACYAGHNKWSKVKHTKGKLDAKKSKLFSKLSLEIASAVRAAGNADPTVNAKLAAALSRAKAANMPKDNIDSATKKGLDKDKSTLEDVVYECYGPGGMAMIIECVTDKPTRTVKEVKEVLGRVGGSVSSVGWLFDKKGKVVFAAGESGHSFDQMMDAAIEAGAEDIEEGEEEDLVEVVCDFTQLSTVARALSEQYDVRHMGPAYLPQSTLDITDNEVQELVEKCLDDMEALDDVVKVHSNVSLP